MIKTKLDLKEYISEDFKKNPYNRSSLRKIIGLKDESYMVRKLLYNLRHVEYYINTQKKGVFNKLLYLFYSYRLDRLRLKMQVSISPNVVGKGLFIPHWHGGIRINCISMGDYCIISSGVIIGNKRNQINRPIIGNNVEMAVGCKIIGKIKIGDNAIIAPNSVVIKDITSNTIVSGIPAEIIKHIKPQLFPNSTN